MQAFYEYINGACILEFLREFLTHEDPNVRAKACSAIGNMCRHSSYFYGSLVSNNSKLLHYILDPITVCLEYHHLQIILLLADQNILMKFELKT